MVTCPPGCVAASRTHAPELASFLLPSNRLCLLRSLCQAERHHQSQVPRDLGLAINTCSYHLFTMSHRSNFLDTSIKSASLPVTSTPYSRPLISTGLLSALLRDDGRCADRSQSEPLSPVPSATSPIPETATALSSPQSFLLQTSLSLSGPSSSD